MNLRALLLVLVPFLLLLKVTLVSSQSEQYLYEEETSGKVSFASPKKSPLPAPPFYKPVPAPPVKKPTPAPPPKVYKPVPPPPVKKPTPPPPAKVTPPPPVKKPSPPPPAKVTPTPPVYKPVPPPPPAKVSPPSPVKPSTPPPPPRPRTTKDCIPLCLVRCKLHSRRNVCLRACVTCCDRCKCVPPGQYGQKEKCGKCYTDMTTRGGKPKCP